MKHHVPCRLACTEQRGLTMTQAAGSLSSYSPIHIKFNAVSQLMTSFIASTCSSYLLSRMAQWDSMTADRDTL